MLLIIIIFYQFILAVKPFVQSSGSQIFLKIEFIMPRLKGLIFDFMVK